MNIVEALNIAKEQGRKVRPIGVNWYVVYENYAIPGFFTRSNRLTTSECSYIASPEEILKDWEVVKEKPSKQTQYKIDSMKFQIVRYCKGRYSCMGCRLAEKCERDGYISCNYAPKKNLLDDWSLKEIVEAYHILKKAGEI